MSQRLPRTTWATKPITFLSPSVTSRVEELGQSVPTQPVQEAADSVMLSQAVKWIHATTVRRLWWPLEGSSQVRSILRVEDQSALKRPIWADVDPSPGDSLATDLKTGIFGSGQTLAEAVRDLLVALGQHRDLLRARDLSRSPQAREHLAYLQDHLA